MQKGKSGRLRHRVQDMEDEAVEDEAGVEEGKFVYHIRSFLCRIQNSQYIIIILLACLQRL